MDCIAQLNLYIIPFAGNTNIRFTQPTQEIKGRLRILAQSQPQRILLAALPGGFFDIVGQAVEAIGWAPTSYALMRALVVVIGNPVSNPLTGVRKGGEKSILQKLRPDGLPEPLDLA